MPVKLGSSECKTIGICALVAGVSLAVGVKYFTRAFPEAAVEFRVNRDDSMPIAARFLAERGVRVEGYRHVAIFSYSDSAKVFMERTLGLERMTELTRGPVRLWRWSHRWFKPQQQEEFRVAVTPAGEVVGFSHVIPEAAPGASLEPTSAREIAEKFLREVMGRDLAGLEFVESESQKRPARTDHDFTWKQKNVDLGEGQWRIEVDVAGDKVSGYHEFVKIPDQWSRDYSKVRSRNETAQQAAEILFAVISVGMLVILVRRLRDRDVPIRLATVLGMVGAGLYFLGQLNNFPMAEFGYPTTDSYSSFFAGNLRNAILAALGVGTWVFFLAASAEPVYRAAYPGLPSLRLGLGWRGLRSRSFFINNIVGITLTFFFLAYQTVFYLTAQKFGAWSPADVNYSDLLSTRIPWVWVLFIGFLPAVSEELQFRAFAIPFLNRFLRSKAVAIVLAAFIWGFLHSNYPSQPFFIRGVEVGIGGIIIGLVMLRFGLLGPLIWHYSVDALYTAFLLLRSSDHYLMVSGAITAGIMLIPLAISLAAYLRTGTFSDDADFTNAAAGVSRAPEKAAETEPPGPLVYIPLSKSRLLLGGGLIAVFTALAFIPAHRFGKDTPVATTRYDALRVASGYLRQRGVDPDSYRSVAWLSSNVSSSTVKYFQQRRSVEESDRIYRQSTRLLLWYVRYFRPLEKEEYLVAVETAVPRAFSYSHTLDEDAPGASLSREKARARATEFLAGLGYRAEDFDLQEQSDTKRKARVDWTFEWQIKPQGPGAALTVDDARFRVRIDIAGDEVVGLSRYFHLPEEWERQRSATSLANVVLYACSSALGMLIVGGVIVIFVRQVRHGTIRWRASAKVAGVFFAGFFVTVLNQLPLIMRSYDTSVPMSTFWFSALAGHFVTPFIAGLAMWVAVALATSLYPDSWRLFDGSARRVWRRDAALAILLGIAASFGVGRLGTLLFNRFHELAPVGIDLGQTLLDSALPGGGFAVRGFIYALSISAVAGVFIYLVTQGWHRRAWWFWVASALMLVTLGPASALSMGEFFVVWVNGALKLAMMTAILLLFFRNNYSAFVGSTFCGLVVPPLVSMLGQPASFYLWNGVALGVLTIAGLVWLLKGSNELEAEASPTLATQP